MRSAARQRPLGDAREDRSPVRSFVTAPPDTLLFASVATLVAIGLVMIYSASSAVAYSDHLDPAYYFKRQLIWLVVGGAIAFGAYRMDYHILKKAAPYLLLASILGVAVVLIPHVGIVVNGARRWIGASFFTLQPSEFAKLGLIVYLAAMLTQRGERIQQLTKGLVPLFVPVLLLALLVTREPDMGTASLLVMTAFAMFFAAGARIPHLAAVIAVILPPVALMVLKSSYQRARVLAFIDPWKDAQNTGFHIVQSLLALGSGGLLGAGLGASRAKFFYLPEQYTDFIFSVLGEELGLVGALAVVLLFVIFAYRAIRIAIASPDRFGFFLVVGCASLVVIQAFVNIGVVTSSWPVTGVPLPFISFGGSSLIVNLVCFALIANVGRFRRVNAR
jgi:cell division protein FtsW